MAETEGGLSEACIYTDVRLSEGPLSYSVLNAEVLSSSYVLSALNGLIN